LFFPQSVSGFIFLRNRGAYRVLLGQSLRAATSRYIQDDTAGSDLGRGG
jgi:hypothetical protein